MIPNKDRIPATGKEGWRKLTVVDAGSSGLPVGAEIKAKVEYADEATQEGKPYNKAAMDEILAASGETSGTAEALTLEQEGFVLNDGATVRIKLHTDMAAGATLNVNGTGAKAIIQSNLKPVSGEQKAGAWLTLTYSLALDAYVLQGMAGSFKVGDVLISRRTDLGDDWLLCNGEVVSRTLYPELHPLLFTRPHGTWTPNNQGSTTLRGVAYGNGYWVAVGDGGTLYYKVKTLPAIALDGTYAYIRAK